MPKGEGFWEFCNGNTSYGMYTQTLRPGEEVDKPVISLSWATKA
jgi:hypothetical protein